VKRNFYPPLYLKRGEDTRLRQGHLWVFSNEIDVKRSPLSTFEPGQLCAITQAGGQVLGIGYINPSALICARILTQDESCIVDNHLFIQKIKTALDLRHRLYSTPFYRLVFGESDGLPGLVVDRYTDVLVGQVTTVGMECLKNMVTDVLISLMKPNAIVWKNGGVFRQLEQLPQYSDVAFGTLQTPVEVVESNLRFHIDPIGGQKTGWFYDQRSNREQLVSYVKGKRVLDLFSYLGGWGLQAAQLGASEVICVDASANAVESIQHNIQLNGFSERVHATKADAFEELKRLRQAGEQFDVVILDPPAFIKRKKDMAEGSLAYRRLNEMAMQLLPKDGILVTCSCSYHLSRSKLLELIQRGASHLKKEIQILSQLQQSPDHPIHPAIPETEYLKGFICRVL